MINWSNFKVVGAELDYLVDAFRSGWVSGGEYVQKLERELNKIFTSSTSFSVANGTLALQLGFQTLGVKPGDHVIVPAFCFQASANVLRQLGAIPVFCDVDPLNWNQTLQSIKKAWTPETVGIVVVHNYGVAAPILEICQWAKQQDLWVIEDCAEAWFTQHAGRYVGQFGDLATFSMHAAKTISCGEGGVVLVNNSILVDKARLLRSHGVNQTRYFHECAGNNYRLSNLLAAVGYAQLEQREDIIGKQIEIANCYRKLLSGRLDMALQGVHPDSVDRLWAVAVNIRFEDLTINRDQLMQRLMERGVETRPGFYSASCFKYNDDSSFLNSEVSDRLHKNIIVLPCALTLTNDDIKFVCENLIQLIEEHNKNYSYRVLKTHEVENAQIKIETFYNQLKIGAASFRYFNKRKFDVISTHLATLLLEVNGDVVGYGHLDPEGDTVWLGIALADSLTGQGWGKLLMNTLLVEAEKLGIHKVTLMVDRDNARAIALYRSFGFQNTSDDISKPSFSMSLER